MVEQVEFKDFKIGELFEIKSTRKVVHSDSVELHNDKTSKEKSPYVVRSALNNGIRGYSEVEDSWLNPGNSISFAQDTFSVFYQEEPYFTGNKVKVMELKGRELNGKIALYFVSLISKAFSGYGWSTGSTSQEILNKKISLPVTSSGTPDYSYMESYISRIEKLHISRIEKLLQELGYNSLEDVELTQEDKEILRLFSGGGEKLTLAEFKIGELFETSLWKYSLQSQNFLSTSQVKTSTHDLAVVTGTVTNNSIAYYVNRNEVNESNIYSETLTMTTRGQSGVVRFQEEEFLLHNNSLALCGVFEKLNKNKKVTLYLMAALNKLGYGDSYSNFPTVKSLSEKKIPLPINPQSPEIPNYSLMESYITAIEKLHVNKLISSNIKEITALNTVI